MKLSRGSLRKNGYRNSAPVVLLLQIAPFCQRGAFFLHNHVRWKKAQGYYFAKQHPKVRGTVFNLFLCENSTRPSIWCQKSTPRGPNAEVDTHEGHIFETGTHEGPPTKVFNIVCLLGIRGSWHQQAWDAVSAPTRQNSRNLHEFREFSINNSRRS